MRLKPNDTVQIDNVVHKVTAVANHGTWFRPDHVVWVKEPTTYTVVMPDGTEKEMFPPEHGPYHADEYTQWAVV